MNEIGLFKYVTIDHHLISSIISLSLRLVIINSDINIYQAYIHILIHEIVSFHFACAPKITSKDIISTNVNRCILLGRFLHYKLREWWKMSTFAPAFVRGGIWASSFLLLKNQVSKVVLPL